MFHQEYACIIWSFQWKVWKPNDALQDVSGMVLNIINNVRTSCKLYNCLWTACNHLGKWLWVLTITKFHRNCLLYCDPSFFYRRQNNRTNFLFCPLNSLSVLRVELHWIYDNGSNFGRVKINVILWKSSWQARVRCFYLFDFSLLANFAERCSKSSMAIIVIINALYNVSLVNMILFDRTDDNLFTLKTHALF